MLTGELPNRDTDRNSIPSVRIRVGYLSRRINAYLAGRTTNTQMVNVIGWFSKSVLNRIDPIHH